MSSATTVRSKLRLPTWAGGVIGIASTVAIWWLLAETVFASVGTRPDGSGGAIPTPLEVVVQLFEDGFEFYWRNGIITLTEAAIGFAWGNALGTCLRRHCAGAAKTGNPHNADCGDYLLHPNRGYRAYRATHCWCAGGRGAGRCRSSPGCSERLFHNHDWRPNGREGN